MEIARSIMPYPHPIDILYFGYFILKFSLVFHFVCQIFSEMDVLNLKKEEWSEQARWIKYEQNAEEETNRWGKPHISSLSFHSLIELRKCLEFGK